MGIIAASVTAEADGADGAAGDADIDADADVDGGAGRRRRPLLSRELSPAFKRMGSIRSGRVLAAWLHNKAASEPLGFL